MGFFRISGSSSSRNGNGSSSSGGGGGVHIVTAAETNSVIALLKAKITQLEDQVAHKDEVIDELQSGLEGGLKCLNKLETMTASTCTANSSFRTLEVSSSYSGGSNASGASTKSGGDPFEENLIISRLTVQLEDKNSVLASLQAQLDEQKMLSSHLQEKLQASEQGKATLLQTVTDLEKKIFDQSNQIECLQALNETNTTIVSEMDLVQSHQASSCVSPQTPNQWKMYQKLQNLMDTNNKMAQQLSTITQEKQNALIVVSSLQKEKLNLCDQMDALTKQLEDKDHQLTQMKLEVDLSMDCSTETLKKLQHGKNVLPEIRQVLDRIPSSDSSAELGTPTAADDPKLLQHSLQACQSQLKQIQRDHELQMQKTVHQSVQLAESRAQVDTLTAKVEHYEKLMDDVIKNSPVVTKLASSSSSSSFSPGGSSHGSSTASKAARELMSMGNDDDKINLLSPTAESSSSSPSGYSFKTSSATRNALKINLSLPRFMRVGGMKSSPTKHTPKSTPPPASSFRISTMMANANVDELSEQLVVQTDC